MATQDRSDHAKISKGAAFKKVGNIMLTNYFQHQVGKNAAALAYYLLFALFPLLIFVSNLLGLLNLDVTAIIETLRRILPTDVVEIIENYLEYISQNSSHTLMWFSLIFSIWFPMRAAKGLMDDVRRAYELEEPSRPFRFIVRQIIYTVVLLIVITLTLLLSVLGENVLSYAQEMLPNSAWHISDKLLTLWQYLRFLPAALLMFIAIGTLYAIAVEKRPRLKTIFPGILAAEFSWLVLSIGFSFYVENFANYSVIYGTLGTVIVLLVWLYLSSVVLILGAELNAALQQIRS